jgi:hypothetical protein
MGVAIRYGCGWVPVGVLDGVVVVANGIPDRVLVEQRAKSRVVLILLSEVVFSWCSRYGLSSDSTSEWDIYCWGWAWEQGEHSEDNG